MDQAWVPSLDSVGQRHPSTKELTICSVVGWGLADSPTGCATRGPPHDMLSLQAQVCSCPHCATFRLQGPSLGLETGLSRTCWIVSSSPQLSGVEGDWAGWRFAPWVDAGGGQELA